MEIIIGENKFDIIDELRIKQYKEIEPVQKNITDTNTIESTIKLAGILCNSINGETSKMKIIEIIEDMNQKDFEVLSKTVTKIILGNSKKK